MQFIGEPTPLELVLGQFQIPKVRLYRYRGIMATARATPLA